MADPTSDILEIFRGHAAAETTWDIAAVMDTVSEQPMWEVWPHIRFEGRAAVQAWYERQIAHFYPHMSQKRSLNQWRVEPGNVFSEAEFAYTPPGGAPLLGRALAIFTIEDGKVVSERIHFTGPAFPALYREVYENDAELYRIPGVTRIG